MGANAGEFVGARKSLGYLSDSAIVATIRERVAQMRKRPKKPGRYLIVGRFDSFPDSSKIKMMNITLKQLIKIRRKFGVISDEFLAALLVAEDQQGFPKTEITDLKKPNKDRSVAILVEREAFGGITIIDKIKEKKSGRAFQDRKTNWQ